MSESKEPDYSKPSTTKAYAALTPNSPLVPHAIERRGVSPDDVLIDVKFAGICHSDIHQVKEEWGAGSFPMVPGHEIAGIVVAIGSNVSAEKFPIGSSVGVGCMVDSCRNCNQCRKGVEQYCVEGSVFTYNGKHKFQHCVEYNEQGGTVTHGGYSQSIVCNKDFVLNIPESLDLAAAAPLLCAGITCYSPMVHFGLQAQHRFGVIGLGGLGHMAAKLAVAFGCHTTVISRGEGKKESALNELGAHAYLNSKDEAAMKAAANSFDFIICCVSAQFDLASYVNLLDFDGKIILVGVPPEALALSAGSLIGGRKTVAASLIGGIKETQDMLDFCGRHNITCDIELIAASQINTAYQRAIDSDVKYRFVIDCSTIG